MNLLPDTEKQSLRMELKKRLIVVAASLLSMSFIIGFITLLPAYILIRTRFSEIEKNNSSKIEEVRQDEIDVLNLPKEVDQKLKIFESSNNRDSVVQVIYEITEKVESGTKVDSISFMRNQKHENKEGIKILISGIAETRESLLSFGNLLKNSKKFYSVDIPVSSFTKEKDLPFTISVFIENKK